MTGFIFIIFGIIYIAKPNIFRRGVWLKTSMTIQTMKPKTYETYMRLLGVALILAGIFFLLHDYKII